MTRTHCRSLFRSTDEFCAPRLDMRDEFHPDVFHKPIRQHAISDAGDVGAAQRAQIGTRPDEAVGLAEHYPRSLGIKAKTLFRGMGDLDGKAQFEGRRMGDRQHRDDPILVFQPRHQDDRAWSIFYAFIATAKMLATPKIGIPNNQALDWVRKRHSAYGFNSAS